MHFLCFHSSFHIFVDIRFDTGTEHQRSIPGGHDGKGHGGLYRVFRLRAVGIECSLTQYGGPASGSANYQAGSISDEKRYR